MGLIPPLNAPAEPFDLTAQEKRFAEFLVTLVTPMFRPPGSAPSERQTAQNLWAHITASLTDQGNALTEIKRLYRVLEDFKRTHVPHAGEPGAPAICECCSLHGAQVPWPCDAYTRARSALPERKS